ncbi:hypothetical protein CHUAL_004776 [Chamberlinius hualienensis]
MASFILICSFCSVLVAVSGQTTLPPPPVIDGPCPAYQPVATLNSKTVDGQYYVLYQTRGGFGPFDAKLAEKCLTMELKSNPDNTFLYSWNLTTADNQKLSGNVTTSLVNGKNTEQTFNHALGDKPIAGEKSTITFLNVATPATHIVYVVCETDGKTHRWTLEIASKQKTLAPTAIENINKDLTANKLPTDLHKIAQTC